MRFLKLILIFSLFGLFGCISKEEDSRRFRGDRDKSERSTKRQARRERRPKAPVSETQTATAPTPAPEATSATPAEAPVTAPMETSVDGEVLAFPISIRPGHSSLDLSSTDSKKITVSAEPDEIAVRAVAGWSGTLFVFKGKTSYKLSLISLAQNKTLYFEFSKEGTNLYFADGASVNQDQVLAESTKPFSFYVKEGEDLTALCFPFENLAEQIQLNKNFSRHADCE